MNRDDPRAQGGPRPRSARVVASSILVALVLAAFSGGSRAPAGPQDGRTAPARLGIVILGGDLAPFLQYPKLEPSRLGSANRVSEAIRLAAEHPQAIVLYTGREGAPGPLPVLVRGGVAGQRIVWEDRSVSTAENATFSAALVRPRPQDRWILVTNDWHMERAQNCFRRAGFVIEPHPVHHVPPEGSGFWNPYREALGRVAYAMFGLCDA